MSYLGEKSERGSFRGLKGNLQHWIIATGKKIKRRKQEQNKGKILKEKTKKETKANFPIKPMKEKARGKKRERKTINQFFNFSLCF